MNEISSCFKLKIDSSSVISNYASVCYVEKTCLNKEGGKAFTLKIPFVSEVNQEPKYMLLPEGKFAETIVGDKFAEGDNGIIYFVKGSNDRVCKLTRNSRKEGPIEVVISDIASRYDIGPKFYGACIYNSTYASPSNCTLDYLYIEMSHVKAKTLLACLLPTATEIACQEEFKEWDEKKAPYFYAQLIKKIFDKNAENFYLQFYSACKILNENKIYHTDLHFENILIEQNGLEDFSNFSVKLIDFDGEILKTTAEACCYQIDSLAGGNRPLGELLTMSTFSNLATYSAIDVLSEESKKIINWYANEIKELSNIEHGVSSDVLKVAQAQFKSVPFY